MDPAFTAEASGTMSSPPPPPPEKDESSSSTASTTARREAEDTAATAVALATSADGGGDATRASAASPVRDTKKKPRTWKDELIEPECQFCRDTRAALMGLVKGTAGAAGGAADRGIDAATGVAGSVRKGTRAARERVERFVSTGVAHAADTEERAFEALKGRNGEEQRAGNQSFDGRRSLGKKNSDLQTFTPPQKNLTGSIKSAKENAPLTSAAALLATALVLAPRPRAALWRATFGRFRSPEAARASAASRAAAAAEEAGLVSKGTAEAWASAEEALARLSSAHTDVTAQARELRSLAARAAAAQRGAASALNDLRSLPGAGDALQSRADAAAAEAAARRQRKAVDDLVWRLAKKGF